MAMTSVRHRARPVDDKCSTVLAMSISLRLAWVSTGHKLDCWLASYLVTVCRAYIYNNIITSA